VSATITITRGSSLPDSASKTDFHNLIDTATGTLSGTLTTSDLSSSAGIVGTQLSASANILDTQLAQITTASKVHGSSLTGLASTPSGAGIIPIANLASGTPDGTKYVRDDGTLVTPSTTAVAGMVVQVVNTMAGAVATCSTAIPLDNTIPQNTEGTQVMTLAITPSSSSNKLLIDVICCSSRAGTSGMACALFQDSTANALAAVRDDLATTSEVGVFHLKHYMTAGTTSATTFKVRIGASSGTHYFNGDNSGTQLFGGVSASSITITEIKA
jgi:hypothetical protein